MGSQLQAPADLQRLKMPS